jgi:hypothetical protein
MISLYYLYSAYLSAHSSSLEVAYLSYALRQTTYIDPRYILSLFTHSSSMRDPECIMLGDTIFLYFILILEL